tara:strand:- start:1983 stop:2396 length:414 start_codon:yes stop_codon:yes gene_type:complete
MSIDYGEKRVGIALSDPLHTISYPLCVINKKNENQLVDEIIKIINDKLVEKIIIGLPLSMSGSYSEQTKKVIVFKDFLIKQLSNRGLSIDIDTIDERLSSVSAKNIMIQQGVKTGHNKGRIDELSASIILQEYLDSK